MDQTLDLLKELTEAHGIPGYEAPVRAVVRKHLEGQGSMSQEKVGFQRTITSARVIDPDGGNIHLHKTGVPTVTSFTD